MWHRLFGEGGGWGGGGGGQACWIIDGIVLWTPCSKFKPKNLLYGANDRYLILVGTGSLVGSPSFFFFFNVLHRKSCAKKGVFKQQTVELWDCRACLFTHHCPAINLDGFSGCLT